MTEQKKEEMLIEMLLKFDSYDKYDVEMFKMLMSMYELVKDKKIKQTA